MKKQILVVQDDTRMRLGLLEALCSEGYVVNDCGDGAEALTLLRCTEPDLVVLDIMLPNKGGYLLCREIRGGSNPVPVLMMAANGEEVDRVEGGECRADGYVIKPFGMEELFARVRGLLGRSEAPVGPPREWPDEIAFGDVRIDCRALCGKREDRTFELSPRELKVVALLFREWGQAVSRDVILKEVWGIAYYGTIQPLDRLIGRLRQKLEATPAKPSHLLTVHGYGYRLE